MYKSPYLIGRAAIASYAGCCESNVTAMIKAGLNCQGGRAKGCPPRCTPLDVDRFFRDHPNFVAVDYKRPYKTSEKQKR